MEWYVYVYFASAILGLVWSLSSMLFGGHHGDAGGADTGYLEGGPGEIAFAPFSPTVISAFLTAFGVTGIVAIYVFKTTPVVSAGVALVMGVGAGLLMAFLMWKLLNATTSTSHALQSDMIGCEAEVITPIPAEGLGEIAYIIKGSRYTASARTEAAEPIGRGAMVVVERVVGSTAFVRPGFASKQNGG